MESREISARNYVEKKVILIAFQASGPYKTLFEDSKSVSSPGEKSIISPGENRRVL